MAERISIGQSLGNSWQIVKDNLPVVLGLTVLSMVFGFAPNPWGNMGETDVNVGPSLAFGLIAVIVSILVSVGVTRIFFRLIDGKKDNLLQSFLAPAPVYLNVIGSSILVALIVILGLVALIIPGIYFAVLYSMTTNFIVDKEVGALEGMRMSAAAVKGNMWYLIGAGIALGLVALAGALALVVGLLVTVPLAQIASLLIYRSLAERAGSTPAVKLPLPPK